MTLAFKTNCQRSTTRKKVSTPLFAPLFQPNISDVPFSDPDETYGLLCEARMEGEVVTLPLGELEDAKPNRQLIDDYCYWFHNWA